MTRVTRTQTQAAQLLETVATAISLDDEDGVRNALAGATHVLSTVPPEPSGADPVLDVVGDSLWGGSGLKWTVCLPPWYRSFLFDQAGTNFLAGLPFEHECLRGRGRRAC